jgi:pimeloyl-ACP methyl ester carboxylesterase
MFDAARPSRGFPRLGAALAMGTLLAVLALLTAGCSGDDPPVEDPPGDYESVTFTSSDDVSLHGRLFGGGAGKPGVVLSHMFPADQRSWQPFAETLAEFDFMVLTFDFRGYGRSEGKKEIDKLHWDVEGAVQLLRERGVRGVFLIGASMGGTASLKVAARENFLGIAALSAPTEFRGLEALTQMAQVETPVLLIAAEDDAARHDAADFFKAAPGTRLIEIYRGDDHGTDLLTGEFGYLVEERLLEFIGAFAP